MHLQRHHGGLGRRDDLDRVGSPDLLAEAGAQRFVPALQLGQAGPQEIAVEAALHPVGHGQVVGLGSRQELLHEPQPLLREGQRQPMVAVCPREHRQVGG